MFGLLRIRRVYLCDHFGAMTFTWADQVRINQSHQRMKTDETNIEICVVFSSSKEVKFKVPAHLELIKKVPLEWKMAVIEYTRIATSFPNAKEN